MMKMSTLHAVAVSTLCLSACGGSPTAPAQAAAPTVLTLGLAGQSNSILMRPFLADVATVVGAGDQVTTIDCWSAGGDCWRGLEPTLHARLDAFVWWQGESDVAAGTSGPVYMAALADLVQRIRATTGNPRLLIVIMQMGTAYSGNLPDGAYQRARQWSAQDGNSVYVETQDLEYRWWDSAHMTEAGYAAVCLRIAAVVRARR